MERISAFTRFEEVALSHLLAVTGAESGQIQCLKKDRKNAFRVTGNFF